MRRERARKDDEKGKDAQDSSDDDNSAEHGEYRCAVILTGWCSFFFLLIIFSTHGCLVLHVPLLYLFYYIVGYVLLFSSYNVAFILLLLLMYSLFLQKFLVSFSIICPCPSRTMTSGNDDFYAFMLTSEITCVSSDYCFNGSCGIA